MDLDKPIQELQRNIIKEILEMIDYIYLNDNKRKESHYVERCNEPNTILTTCGEVKYERTYYKCIKDKNPEGKNKYEYLVDTYAGITPGMRKRYLEKIYIMGDGASWIKTGLEVLGAKSIFVLDKFHLSQSITRATAHLGDSVFDARFKIYDAISMEDLDEIKEIFNVIADDSLTTKGKRKQIMQIKGYIINHWDAIIIRNNDEHARMGCSAEGSISHIYLSRLSSRPLGWSKTGVDKISRLKVYIENGGNVCDLMAYQKEKKERKIEEHIREQVDQQIRKERHKYCHAFEHTTIALNNGKRTGLHRITKALRGICG